MPAAPMTTAELERSRDGRIPAELRRRAAEEDARRIQLKRDILFNAEIGTDLHLTADEVISLAAMLQEHQP